MNCRYCASPLEADALFCVECGRSVAEASAPTLRTRGRARARVVEAAEPPAREPNAAEAPVARSADPEPATPEPATPELPADTELPEDTESTRLMASRGRGERYVLQFSTGESVVVAGTGIIGRNPAAEPGEYVDELVTVFDVGKSVSKSHVEFGQDSGSFWVCDRYSTNGTVVRGPDADPVRCEPGKRYLVARGSRVEIGDQFFIVS